MTSLFIGIRILILAPFMPFSHFIRASTFQTLIKLALLPLYFKLKIAQVYVAGTLTIIMYYGLPGCDLSCTSRPSSWPCDKTHYVCACITRQELSLNEPYATIPSTITQCLPWVRLRSSSSCPYGVVSDLCSNNVCNLELELYTAGRWQLTTFMKWWRSFYFATEMCGNYNNSNDHAIEAAVTNYRVASH